MVIKYGGMMDLATTISGVSTDWKNTSPIAPCDFVMPKIANIEEERANIRKALKDGKECIVIFDDECPKTEEKIKEEDIKGVFQNLKASLRSFFLLPLNDVTLPYVHLRRIRPYPFCKYLGS